MALLSSFPSVTSRLFPRQPADIPAEQDRVLAELQSTHAELRHALQDLETEDQELDNAQALQLLDQLGEQFAGICRDARKGLKLWERERTQASDTLRRFEESHGVFGRMPTGENLQLLIFFVLAPFLAETGFGFGLLTADAELYQGSALFVATITAGLTTALGLFCGWGPARLIRWKTGATKALPDHLIRAAGVFGFGGILIAIGGVVLAGARARYTSETANLFPDSWTDLWATFDSVAGLGMPLLGLLSAAISIITGYNMSDRVIGYRKAWAEAHRVDGAADDYIGQQEDRVLAAADAAAGVIEPIVDAARSVREGHDETIGQLRPLVDAFNQRVRQSKARINQLYADEIARLRQTDSGELVFDPIDLTAFDALLIQDFHEEPERFLLDTSSAPDETLLGRLDGLVTGTLARLDAMLGQFKADFKTLNPNDRALSRLGGRRLPQSQASEED